MPYAMHIPRAGGPEVFERVDVPRPAPGPGQLLMRVAAVGVNFIETSYNVQPGDTVLTYAGAGGVGLLLTQMLKHRGATVITTTSTPEKAEAARKAGADHVLTYSEVPEGVRELTGGRGVDVVYDGVGKDTFEGSLSSLRIRGTLVLFRGASGQLPPFDLQRLNAHGSLTVTTSYSMLRNAAGAPANCLTW